MARTVYDEYNLLLINGSWKYYTFHERIDMGLFSNIESMRSFLSMYLGKGEKSGIEIFDYLNAMPTERLQHTISCFLLGTLLYERCPSISKDINSVLNKFPINNDERFEERFRYIWLLISLFHDFGYAIENNLIEYDKEQFDTLMSKFPRSPKSIPRPYSKTLLINYEKYRKCRFGVNDHGICGGIKLFSDLCELREDKSNHNGSNNYWGEDLIKLFSLAAWTVACHNIWFVNENDRTVECYRHCLKLDKLVYQEKFRNIKESPFLFLLCLVDSIEPIKIFNNKDSLHHIAFDFSNTTSINIQIDGLCQPKKNHYLSKIKELNDWLTDTNNTTLRL